MVTVSCGRCEWSGTFDNDVVIRQTDIHSSTAHADNEYTSYDFKVE